jgi:hypothetical protein
MSITQFRVMRNIDRVAKSALIYVTDSKNLSETFPSDAKPQAPTVLFLVPNSGPQNLKCGQKWVPSYYEKQITKERKY